MAAVTIGIPFYNNEETLKYAIQSVINQTYVDWHLYLINDGSTDRSLEIARQFESSKIKIIDDGENKGLISRLNQLIDISESEYFVRMDADDIMVPERIERQISLLEARPEIDLAGASAYIINNNNSVTGIRIASIRGGGPSGILKNGLFIHPTVTGRTRWFKKYKYKEGFYRAEDLELWCRSSETSNFAIIKEPLLFYRDSSLMNLAKYKESSKTVRKIIKLYANSSKQKVILLFKENFKISVYTILDLLRFTKVANRRRNSSIDQLQAEKALAVLRSSIN
ncbi:hypothetical protein J6TS1_32660 [Siminovitchia terrae]|uniref:Glycosyltransferase family 2 protein n=1 Tax=Siminovitchia terrae TaxID=1914933 RepID=A0A429X9L7_SIMTE|nr:glycosyltransferase family A protein [Siminovitchia terrae]RST60066.1 glycosyltransferase family 2 protein [Siminovitchia terrae]GIN92570.1 hypothetical protein J22TS1_36210 [Siminovitchia terrae]GIN97396.1 hypothetical protein J6TS1_32660 [Siminovitchia terrae]